jgi:hypothetical protein
MPIQLQSVGQFNLVLNPDDVDTVEKRCNIYLHVRHKSDFRIATQYQYCITLAEWIKFSIARRSVIASEIKT